jgi:hypothetical protein
MKKVLIITLLLFGFSVQSNCAYSLTTKSSDYVIDTQSQSVEETVNKVDETLSNVENIYENENVSVVKLNDKYGIIDKSTKQYIFAPILDSVTKFSDDEFKIKYKDLVGYLNSTTQTNFLTNYDNIFLLDNYLKIKKDGKYGIIDKKSNIILPPIYQSVGIRNYDDTEYLAGKLDGSYKLYKNTGRLLEDNEVYQVDSATNTVSDVRTAITVNSNSNSNKSLVASDIKTEIKDYWKTVTPVEATKVASTQLVNDVKSELKATESQSYEIQEIELPKKVKVAKIEKNDIDIEISGDTTKVKKGNYTIFEENDKLGLTNKKGNVIVNSDYDEITLAKPCKHFVKPIVIATKNNVKYVFDTKGNLIAEEIGNSININQHKKEYTYTLIDNKYVLTSGENELGYLEKIDDKYKYTNTQSKFSLLKPHKINKLFETIISIH